MNRIPASSLAGLIGSCALGAMVVVSGCAHSGTTVETTSDSSTGPRPGYHVIINPSIKRVEATNNGFRVTESIQFAENKSDILPACESLLVEVATVIKDNPDLLNVYVAGYASSDGGAELNSRLSLARARSVRDWLVSNGIRPERISVGGYGSSAPRGDNDTQAGRELNRRVDFIAIKYVHAGRSYVNVMPPGGVTM